jgi:hypothetical protein
VPLDRLSEAERAVPSVRAQAMARPRPTLDAATPCRIERSRARRRLAQRAPSASGVAQEDDLKSGWGYQYFLNYDRQAARIAELKQTLVDSANPKYPATTLHPRAGAE